ncbi:MAG: methyltransferase domain-containing protein [Candidatus Thalassarchaeaceae archaeon]
MGTVRALEIGSGSGAVSISLAERGWSVTAIDVNPMAVAATRANTHQKGGTRGGLHRGVFRRERISLREGMFDLIVWNLPYIGVPSDPPSLEVIEEASMIDTGSGGWASELRSIPDGESRPCCLPMELWSSSTGPTRKAPVSQRTGSRMAGLLV